MAHHRSRKHPMHSINVVPYIDVMLVMLVVFMITAPMLTEGVRVNLPIAAKTDAVETEGKESFMVTVDQDGHYFVGGQKDVVTSEDLFSRAAAILRREPTTQVLVKGDRAVDYGAVIHVMGLLRQAGAPSVGLITEGADIAPTDRTNKK